VKRIVLQSPSHVMAAHVMALLGNQPEEEPVPFSAAADPIAVASMENLLELTAMMNYN